MTDDDKFFERLRGDARSLRHKPDAFAMTRIRARIRERIEESPTVLTLLAAWFRPLAATLTAIAIAAAIGLTAFNTSDETSLGDNPVEISMAGDTYRVAN
ncbi:MAG TPA: hypothetical protein VJZ00_02020 [Thermoanaerobaculia bacterium]|nr:hypothetical protein [Thermoanaerobaculia bacterium]